MRWLQLSALALFVLSLVGCKAPVNESYETKLTVLKPWDNQTDGKPIYTRLDTRLTLSYLLADNALVKVDNIYLGKARFKLILNGIDITNKQRKAVCGTEIFRDGFEPTLATTEVKNDPVACFSRLNNIVASGHALKSVDYVDGFFVRNVGSGGEIEFTSLEPLESALITGINTLTLQPLTEQGKSTTIQFIFYGQAPEITVTSVTNLQGGYPVLAGEMYQMSLKVIGDIPLKATGYEDVVGKKSYSIKFFDTENKEILADVSPDGRLIDLPAINNYPDVANRDVNRADVYYELTDAAGTTQRKGLVMNGSQLKEFMGLQVNGSFFNAFEKVLTPMLQRVIKIIVPLIEEAIPTQPKDSQGNDAVINGPILAPVPIDGSEGFVNTACTQFLTKVTANNKRCAFYVKMHPIERLPSVDLGFTRPKDAQGNRTPKMHLDFVFPQVKMDIELAAYDVTALQVGYKNGIWYNAGTYLGGFKTTIVFDDLAMRDTVALGKSLTPFDQCKRAAPKATCDTAKELEPYTVAFMQGLTQGEGYSFRNKNDYKQKLAELIFGTGSNYNPALEGSQCIGNICKVDAGPIEAIVNMGMLPVRMGLIKAVESQVDLILPSIVKSFVTKFPDIAGIRKTTAENTADQVVKRVSVDGGTHQLVRNLTTRDVDVKDLNLLSFFDIGTNYAGMMRFSGSYQVTDEASKAVVSQQFVTPFVEANKFDDLNGFKWKHIIQIDEEGKEPRKEQVDMVTSISLNAFNQYLSGLFQLGKLDGLLNQRFVVNPDHLTNLSLKEQTLSLMVNRFNGVIQTNDTVEIAFEHTQPPEISFVGGKESKWQYSYDLLFGLIKGGNSDTQVTPSIKVSFKDSHIRLSKVNNSNPEVVFDVKANFSIEANIGFENGLPKLYVKTPQPLLAAYEEQGEKRLDKRLVIDINEVSYINPAILTDNALAELLVDGKPTNDVNKKDPRLKVLISNPFVGVYQEQIALFFAVSGGVETYLDAFVKDYLRENFSTVINFNDYRCGDDDPNSTEPDLRVSLLDPNPKTTGETGEMKWNMHKFFVESNPVLVKAHTKWFTTDTSSGWLNVGVDFTSTVLADGEECPDPLSPMSICFTGQSLNGKDPACRKF